MDVQQTDGATPTQENVISEVKDNPHLLQVTGMLDLGLRDTHVLVTGECIATSTHRCHLRRGAQAQAEASATRQRVSSSVSA